MVGFFRNGRLAARILVGGFTALALAAMPACSGNMDDPSDGEWTSLTPDNVELGAAFYYVAADEIYAIIGDSICVWDGQSWVEITAPTADLQPAFQRYNGVIYAVIGEQICKWDEQTQAWLPVAQAAGLKAAFHIVSETEIYAVINYQICVWDGQGWTVITAETQALQPSFRYIDGQFYAVLGNQVCRWDDQAQNWAIITEDTEGLQPAFSYVDGEVYAVIANQICVWNGSGWDPITSYVSNLRPAMQMSETGAIYALIGNQVYTWQ